MKRKVTSPFDLKAKVMEKKKFHYVIDASHDINGTKGYYTGYMYEFKNSMQKHGCGIIMFPEYSYQVEGYWLEGNPVGDENIQIFLDPKTRKAISVHKLMKGGITGPRLEVDLVSFIPSPI